MDGIDDTTSYDDPMAFDATDPSAGMFVDSDADGLTDAFAQDLDGDGSIDSLGYDTDGDGIIDTTVFDTDGDGIADTALFDDGAGGHVAVVDSDGDGTIDLVAVDYDGDGTIDASTGSHDAAVPPTEVTEVSDDDPAALIEGEPDNGPFVTDDQPDEGADGVHGDPRGDMEYHQMQEGPVDCLPTSVAMAISEATGDVVDSAELVTMANDLGFMSDSGMSIDDAATLFENYGLDTEVGTGDLDDLRAALDAGDPVIVGIDAADLYSGDGGPFDQGMVSGHAVVITGIDDGPPEVIYINDPGFPDGAGLEIPADQFEDAWQDSDHAMITATAPVEPVGADETAGTDAGATTGLDGVMDEVRRVFFLPLTFKVAD